MPVDLDFSKAQPLEDEKDKDSGVALDFSKAQPLHAESSSVSPIAPPTIRRPAINVHPSYLIGDPEQDATPRSALDQVGDAAKNLYQTSTAGIAASIAHRFAPGAMSSGASDTGTGLVSRARRFIGRLGGAAEENATPAEHLPSQLAENLAMMAVPGAEGEGGEATAATPSEAPAPVSAVRPRIAPTPAAPAADTMLGRAGEVAIDRIHKIPGVKLFKDLNYIARGDGETAAEAPPAPIPQTNGVEWGSGGQGPLNLRGKMIPADQVPAEPVQTPLAPRWRDATHLNEEYAGAEPPAAPAAAKTAPTYRDATLQRARNVPDFAGDEIEEQPAPVAAQPVTAPEVAKAPRIPARSRGVVPPSEVAPVEPITQPSAPEVPPQAPASQYPPAEPAGPYPKVPQAVRGYREALDDQAATELVHEGIAKSDRAAWAEINTERRLGTPKGILTGQVDEHGLSTQPVTLTKTRGVRNYKPQNVVGTLDDDLTPLLQKSLEEANRRGKIAPEVAPNAEPEPGSPRESETVPEPIQPSTTPATGSETKIRVPGEDRNYKATYQIRELEDVHPSHNGETFSKNPQYSLTNDRDYENVANRGKIVQASGGGFDPAFHITDNPDATNGPIVVDSEGHALGGNGRAMILQRVYKGNPEAAQAYRDMLTQKAGNFGIDTSDIAKMKQPVLVREIADSEFDQPHEKQNAITDFNKKGTAELTPAERAIADARRVSQETLDHIATKLDAAGPDGTLADVLRGQSGSEVIDQLIQDGALTPQDRAAFVGSSGLTDAGKARVSDLMVARFFEDPAQMDAAPSSLRGKLEKISAPLARVESLGEWNLTDTVREAVSILEEMRTHNINLEDLQRQSGLFGSSKYSPEAIAMAEQLKGTSSAALVKSARQYASDAADSTRPLLLGQQIQPAQAFAEAFQGK